MNLKKPATNKFITPKVQKDYRKHRSPVEIPVDKIAESAFEVKSDDESEVVEDSECSSNSFSSRFLHYRVKKPYELNDTLHTRI